MASIFENKDRRVIPNWRSFQTTLHLGELSEGINVKNIPKVMTPPIQEYIDDFTREKTIFHAGDLISIATVYNIPENEYVKEAAKYILDKTDDSNSLQINLSQRILGLQDPHDSENNLDVLTIENQERFDIRLYHNRIAHYKVLTRKYPQNSIWWVELARFYSTLGIKEKSLNAMKVALATSTDNRFVLRSAARLFAHFDEHDYAHDIVRRSAITQYDPWLLSTEIALATLRGRNSRFIKRGSEMIDSKNYSPFSLTELASSLGTIELSSGNYKKSRDYFKKALQKPNDNTLAQVEWASGIDKQLRIDPFDYNVEYSFEALAQESFDKDNYVDSINYAFRWLMDMPYSKRSVMFGSKIAQEYINNSELSRKFLEFGLNSHPQDPMILNNLAYSYALENDIENSEKIIRQTENVLNIEDTTKICLLATKGLINFRKGNPEIGRALYHKALDDCKEVENRKYFYIALLNLAREEFLIASEHSKELHEYVNQIPNDEEETIIRLKKIAIETYKEQVLNKSNSA